MDHGQGLGFVLFKSGSLFRKLCRAFTGLHLLDFGKVIFFAFCSLLLVLLLLGAFLSLCFHDFSSFSCPVFAGLAGLRCRCSR